MQRNDRNEPANASRNPRADAGGPDKGRRPAYLTERQKAVLDYIAGYQADHGIAPTHREIRDHFGYSSFGTVYKHLKLLQRKGYLHRDWNQKRGLELVRAVPGQSTQTEVPFLGLIAAGQPIEALPGDESLSVPNHLFGGHSSDHYVLRVTGESMIQEGIHDGDFVIVLRRKEARPGEMVVALVEGIEATLKRFYPEGKKVRLQPSNPDMKAIRLPAAAVQVQGVVVGLMRKY
ncbi:MAG TPA: transcriptional repressor LexA [Thermoanaerobaculia bacterium]|jgi:repressor LexA